MAEQTIPTPEEIGRVTAYLQRQSQEAIDALIAAKREKAQADDIEAATLVLTGHTTGADFERRPWDDLDIPWHKRGDIVRVRLDFSDGSQAFVAVAETGDALDVTIQRPESPETPPAS